jgi:hypothetical protein
MSTPMPSATAQPSVNRSDKYACCFQKARSLRMSTALPQNPRFEGVLRGVLTRMSRSVLASEASAWASEPTAGRNATSTGTISGVITRTSATVQPASRTVAPTVPSGSAVRRKSSVR